MADSVGKLLAAQSMRPGTVTPTHMHTPILQVSVVAHTGGLDIQDVKLRIE